MNALFNTFEKVLLNDESMRFQIKRTDKGLEVTVTPELTSMDDNLPEDVKNLRAHLATPLFLIGTGEELDIDFVSKLEKYSEARAEVKDAFESLLQTLDKATTEIKNKENDSGKSKKSTKKSSVEKPADESENNSSSKTSVESTNTAESNSL